MCITAISTCVVNVPKKQSSKYMQARLHFALQMLREFFYAGGSGLTVKDLDTQGYIVRTHIMQCIHVCVNVLYL